MSDGLWVIVGVLLGFVGAYLLQRLQETRRKKQLRTVARNIIGLEIIHNLGIVGHIEESVMDFVNNTSLYYQTTIPIRSEVFNQFLNLSSLSVFDDLEQKLLVEAFNQLNIVARDYEAWPQKMGQVILNDEFKKTGSRNLLNHIKTLRINLMSLLCEICLREKEGLQDEQLNDSYRKLRRFNNKQDYKSLGLLGKSSHYKPKKKGEEKYKCLVVWEHDYPECPLEVIELQPSREGDNS